LVNNAAIDDKFGTKRAEESRFEKHSVDSLPSASSTST